MTQSQNFSYRNKFDQVMVPNYAPTEFVPERGEGSRVWDVEGKAYIDFAGGIAVSVLGHRHPAMLAALSEQADKIWHLSNVFPNKPAIKLAEKLCEATFAERVFFCNSGGEANEAAFKLARRYAFDQFGQEKHEIIAFDGAFHGRTLFTVSVGGQAKYSTGFGPAIEGISHLPFNDIAALQQGISDKTCAVVLEPIQGEAGVINADPDFVEAARQLCDKHQALLIFDEIQTGVGRTGHLYAYQGLGITPDILTTAKALGGGIPIGAMLTTAKMAASMSLGVHGSTFGGNPLACAVGSVILETVTQPEVLKQVVHKRRLFELGLADINHAHPFFEQMRGQGLLIGLALTPAWQGKAKVFLKAAAAEGLMILVAGSNVLRIAPSLLIPDEDIKAGLSCLKRAVAKTLAKGDED